MIALPGGNSGSGGNGSSMGAAGRNLALRIVSAALLAPIVLAAAYLGGWFFIVLCALAAGGILWEWTRLVTGRSDPFILAPGGLALLAATVFVGKTGAGAAAAVAILIGAATTFGAVTLSRVRPMRQARAAWGACGVLYGGAAFLGPALLRRDDQFGLAAFLFLAATVWMTDICAYGVGRTVGGPLLLPQVSPSKTWSGAVGGLIGGVAGGTAVAYASGLGKLGLVGVVALVLSALAQAGDLLESAVKRHFGAKDTSGLIPGHGGLMDRLDGFLVAALAALLIGILRHGTDAAGHGLLVW